MVRSHEMKNTFCLARQNRNFLLLLGHITAVGDGQIYCAAERAKKKEINRYSTQRLDIVRLGK